MRPLKTIQLRAIVLLFIASSPYLAAQLVVNPGFETGNFSGWTTTPSPPEPDGTITSNFGVESANPHSGVFNAFFAGGGFSNILAAPLSFDSISQNIATVPGGLYALSFWLRNDGFEDFEFRASFGGTVVKDIVTDFNNPVSKTFGYTQFVVPGLVATGNTTVLQFDGAQFPEGGGVFRLDDVSVFPCPPLNNPGHIGPPIVSLNADAAGAGQPHQPVPLPFTIRSGQPLSLVATALIRSPMAGPTAPGIRTITSPGGSSPGVAATPCTSCCLVP